MDGWVTVGTRLDTKQLEKDIKSSEKRLRQYEKEAERLTQQKVKAQVDLQPYEEAKKNIQELTEESFRYAQTQQEVDALLENENTQLQKLSEQYSKELGNLSSIENKIKENTNQQDLLNKEIQEMNDKLNQSKGFDNISKGIKNISSETSKVIKKVAKWALAVFSIRSAYMFVRSAISTLSQYNEQFAVDIEYIRYALANLLQPVIEGIINLAKILLSYIGYIAKAWFGVNIWAKSSADNFQRAKDGVNGVSKEVGKLKKQLAGFDEMNILQEDGSVSQGGGGGGTLLPSFDLSDWQDIEIPKWVKWIADNRNLILGTIAAIAAGIAAIKIANFLKNLKNIFSVLKGIKGLKLAVLIAGIALAIMGIIDTFKGIIEFIKNPSWENFNKILEGLTLTLLGVGAAMVALNASNPVGWVVLATGAVAALVTGFSELARSLFENKANIMSVEEAQNKLTEAINKTREATENHKNALDEYDNALKNSEEAAKLLEQAEKKNKISGAELAEQVANGTLKYEDMTDAQKEVYKAYYNNLVAQDNLKTSTENLKTSTENLTKAKKEETKASWENQLAIAKERGTYYEFRDAVVKAYKDGELSAGEARDYIERAMTGMSEASKKTFTQDLPNDIKKGLDPNKYESAWTKFKNAWNNFWNGLKKQITMYLSTTVGYGGGGSSGHGFAKGGIVYYGKGGIVSPIKCAKGSIISQPGRGVPISRAIGGEAGREGVIPLTDAQQMAILGEAIGKYININLTNITKLDNRQISREQKIINAKNDFAYNK